jgi:hypothetical protein
MDDINTKKEAKIEITTIKEAENETKPTGARWKAKNYAKYMMPKVQNKNRQRVLENKFEEFK